MAVPIIFHQRLEVQIVAEEITTVHQVDHLINTPILAQLLNRPEPLVQDLITQQPIVRLDLAAQVHQVAVHRLELFQEEVIKLPN